MTRPATLSRDISDAAAHKVLGTRDDAPDACCSRCAEPVDAEELSVEAFELCGDLVCEGCAEEVFEENGQFGVGA